MVLGGFSQGAAVMGFVTASSCPKAFRPLTCRRRCRRRSPTTSPLSSCSVSRRHASCAPSSDPRSPSARSTPPNHRPVRRQRPGVRPSRDEFLRAQPLRRQRHRRPRSGLRGRPTSGDLGVGGATAGWADAVGARSRRSRRGGTPAVNGAHASWPRQHGTARSSPPPDAVSTAHAEVPVPFFLHLVRDPRRVRPDAFSFEGESGTAHRSPRACCWARPGRRPD